MPDASTLALFLGATLALNVTPGPDMLYVIARSGSEGRRAGIVSALGISTGGLVHTALVAAGLSRLLAAVPAAYDAVRFAGAAYLVYLGVRALARPARGGDRAAVAPPPASLGAIYRQGIVTNVLNPKVALFFLAFLPQFVDARLGSAWAQLVFLGVLFNVSGTIVNVVVALAASGAADWARRRATRSAALLQRLTGALFIALGVRLALAGRR